MKKLKAKDLYFIFSGEARYQMNGWNNLYKSKKKKWKNLAKEINKHFEEVKCKSN